MKKEKSGDPRIKTSHFAWKEFLFTYAVLSVLSAGQWMIYAEYMEFTAMPFEYIFGMAGYWAIVAGVFVWITHFQIRKKYDEPTRRLSQAAKDVANGDFSVHVEPLHPADKHDYMDVMFEDFNKMVEELGTIETMKTDFISNVSHEIKTPLAIIQNYAMALQKADISLNERREYTSTIIAASQKLNALVTNILKLSKLENQRIVPALAEFDLCRQLADCALSFEEQWEEKNITFNADIEDKAVLYADAELLEIVWNNLLSNALKFTDPGGEISLKQTSEEDTVTVTVSDTGCGMDEKTLSRIFDKFYQGDTSRSQEGNGLGLALALRVIELMGGRICVKSKPGVGSAFTVSLKAAP
jgi:signal transduction histidine kinase